MSQIQFLSQTQIYRRINGVFLWLKVPSVSEFSILYAAEEKGGLFK